MKAKKYNKLRRKLIKDLDVLITQSYGERCKAECGPCAACHMWITRDFLVRSLDMYEDNE